ncbi:MAG TPA: hypothetical protein VMX17_04625 [Candidatus Glassbacteria bacterium]|nr:hypothetical protein [Candidatus Glassbacteria bacterium]
MKKHPKNDYPIRTLCFLIEKQGELSYLQLMKEFTEAINTKWSHGDYKLSPDSILINNKIRY